MSGSAFKEYNPSNSYVYVLSEPLVPVSKLRNVTPFYLMANGLLKNLVLGAVIAGNAMFVAKEARAEALPWSSISDIVPQAVGESVNYTSSSSAILPNKLTAICYIIDPSDNTSHVVGGFDLQNGIATKGYYNQDWNRVTLYGLINGDTANTGANPGNSYMVWYKVFYDKNGNGNFEAPYNGYFINDTEQLYPAEYSITDFTPFDLHNPGTFTFTLNLPGPTNSVLTALSMSALSGGTNQVTFSVAVSNAVSFTINYKNSLTNATWESLGSYSKTGAVTVITDTNSVPRRFYRVVTP